MGSLFVYLLCTLWEPCVLFFINILLFTDKKKKKIKKSELILDGRIENLEAIAFALGYHIGKLPSVYFHLPLCSLFKLAVVWVVVKERI